jgi:hypothetical protein
MTTDALDIDRPSNGQQTTSTSRLTALRGHLVERERALWGLVAVVLCADVLSTYVGLAVGGTEGNPIVRTALADGGFAAFTALKLAAVSFGVSAWVVMPRPNRLVVPLGLALPWTATTLVNLGVLLG